MPLRRLLTILAFTLAFGPAPSSAEIPENCALTELTNPTRYMLACEGALTIELEAGTVLQYSDDNNGFPGQVILQEGRVLIEVEPGTDTPQVRTPHAIAAVRGTVYAVDAGVSSTAIFVLRGEVEVRSRFGLRTTAILTEGQGVDVVPGQSFSVVEWPQERVRSLLSRFGR